MSFFSNTICLLEDSIILIIDDESDQEDIGKRWMNSEYMPELRQPEKRSFDDCVDSTTVIIYSANSI
jgi:hypothetical protein